MPVQEHRLKTGEEGLLPVEMAPAHLNKSDARIGEEIDCLSEHIGRGDEIRIENEDQIGGAEFHAMSEGTCFEPLAASPADVGDRKASFLQSKYFLRNNFRRLIRGVVKYLNGDFFRGVIKIADSSDQTPCHARLIVERKLNRDWWKVCECRFWERSVLSVLEKEYDNTAAVQAIACQADQNGKITEVPEWAA